MIPKEHITGQDLRETVLEVGQATLSLSADGYKNTTAMVYDVLVKAASEGISIEAACADLDEVVDGNTIRSVLNEQLDITHLRDHEQELNDALGYHLPRQIRTQRLEGAIDYHDVPFYGKQEALRAVVCRGQAQKGTTRFIRIASAYVIYRQLRLTLAVTFVLPDDSTLAVVKRLYQQRQARAVRLRVLYLDKGFWSGKVIRYLQAVRQPAVLACAIRGKQGGTRQLCRGRKRYRTPYTFTAGTTAEMAVVATLVPDKTGQRRRKWILFVVVNLPWPPKRIYQRYRRRFGIECSYRSGEACRIKTSSSNPALRFFLMGFALLLVNLWAVPRWFIARLPGRGPHRVQPTWFRLQRFLQLLRRAVEQRRGVIQSVPVRCPS